MASLTLEVQQLETPDPVLTSKIVTYLKSQGVFDQFRRECMADVDTKPAYQNLRHRVEGSVKTFLQKNPWRPEMNKNQLRDKLRKHIHSGGFLDMGVDRIVDQVVNPKIYSSFLPKVEEVVQHCLKLDDNDKPVFVAPPRVQQPPQPLRFKDRHNLAPRAKVPAPLTGPRLPIIPNIEALKPPEPLDHKELSFPEEPGTPELDESSDKNYTMDDNDVEENAEDDEEDEEEEESPPFEPHSENDRLILGIRTDSSDDSCDIQVVTTVVDDDLEERIDKEDKMEKENNDIKEEDDEEESSSDEYVPKTPTINMEGSDGTVIEFNSISEYRQYQTKFDEENFGDVEEEVVCSQWTDESSSHIKEERSSNEEDSVGGSRKRKLHNNSFDDASNSSVDKGSTSDEGGTSTAIDVCRKRLKLKSRHESEIEKESTSDEEKSIRSNSDSTKKQQLEDYQHESETEKGITSDEEQTLRSNYFSSKKVNIEGNESEIEKNNTSDEEKSIKSHYFSNSKSKLKEDRDGSETEKDNSSDEGKSNDFNPNELELEENEFLKGKESRLLAELNEDSNHSNPEQFFDLVEPKSSQVACNLNEKHKSSSSSSKDSERSHRHHGQKGSSSHHRRFKDRVDDEDNKKEGSVSSSSSKDRHDSSRDRHKTRERKKSESSFSHSTSKHHDKNIDTPDNDRNGKDSIENDLRHKHHKDRPRVHDKEKKKHDGHDKNSERKKDRDTKHSSKHGLVSEKHSYRSSSERHKSDKEHKPRESSDKHRRHDKKSDKDNKQDSKKRHRERCKTSKNNESRRSTDRDSNGPSGRGHTSSLSKSSSTKSNVETSVDSGERTSSNSDNTVSDNVEVLHSDSSKVIALNTQGSPNHEMVEDSWVESDNISSDQNDNSHDSYNTDQQLSDSSFEVKDGRMSRSGKTGEYNKESGDESEARRNIDEAELVQFEGLDVLKVAEPASSTHDNSSEKENIELTLDTSGNLSSPDSEGSIVKFKKPKIAANIYEVKKIMLARRKMKHMEKKRMKQLIKTTEQFPSNNCIEELQEEFNGFGEILSDKKEKYDVLIQRLTTEIESDEVTSVSPNLTTSWIDVSPDLDDYIENTLKGKVHRKIRVRLPPISDEHYKYDSELNAYILLDMGNELPLTREEKVDGNLNNLEPSFENKEMFYDNLSIEGYAGTFNGSSSKSRNKSCKLNPLQYDSEISVKTKDVLSGISKIQNHNLPQTSKEITSKQESEMENCDVSALVSTKSNTSNPIIAKPKVLFSLTYNETYKEILKEKNEAPIRTKTPQTVVKITNDRLSEQVVVKTVQQTSSQKYPLPTITKSEPRVNGQISASNPTQNETPLISRITKSKNIKVLSSSTTKSSPVNGNISPDFTIKFEGDMEIKMSPEVINTMIGIQVGDADQGSPSQEPQVDRRQARESKPAGLRQQRYDSTDLYKPRPQLTSRRGRACYSLSGSGSGVTIAETRRKRAAAPSTAGSTKKRR